MRIARETKKMGAEIYVVKSGSKPGDLIHSNADEGVDYAYIRASAQLSEEALTALKLPPMLRNVSDKKLQSFVGRVAALKFQQGAPWQYFNDLATIARFAAEATIVRLHTGKIDIYYFK